MPRTCGGVEKPMVLSLKNGPCIAVLSRWLHRCVRIALCQLLLVVVDFRYGCPCEVFGPCNHTDAEISQRLRCATSTAQTSLPATGLWCMRNRPSARDKMARSSSAEAQVWRIGTGGRTATHGLHLAAQQRLRSVRGTSTGGRCCRPRGTVCTAGQCGIPRGCRCRG